MKTLRFMFYLLLTAILPVQRGGKISRIVLIEPKSPEFHVFSAFRIPRLGLVLLATILKQKGYEVTVFIEDIASIRWGVVRKADLVLIGSITATANLAYRYADIIRKWGMPVVMGGVHPTFMPDEALEHCDYVIKGEAEDAILELMDVLNCERDPETVMNLSYRDLIGKIHHNVKRRFVSLSNIPTPDITLIWGFERMRMIPYYCSRGCRYNCTFCSVIPMFGRVHRRAEVSRILGDLRNLVEIYSTKMSRRGWLSRLLMRRKRKGTPTVFFYDDCFNADPIDWMLEIAQGIIDAGIQINWTAQVRSSIKDLTEEDLNLLYRSGFRYAYVGFESVNEQALKEYKKGQKLDHIIECIEVLRRHKIKIHGMFVLGAPSDTVTTIWETVRFALKHKIDTIQLMILTPLPGSRDYYVQDGYSLDLYTKVASSRIFRKVWRFYNAHHVNYEPDKIPAHVLQKEVSKAMMYFYSAEEVWKAERELVIYKLVGFIFTRLWYIRNIFAPIRVKRLSRKFRKNQDR